MTALFFYGSLRHVPLLEIVLGRSADRIDMQPARLEGHRVFAAAEGPFPILIPHRGGVAEGLLVQGLTAEDIARLDFYEAGFDFDLRGVTLSDGQGALVYFPADGRWTPAHPWSLAEWEDRYAALSTRAAVEVMSHLGRKTPAEIAGMFGMIRSRAAATLNAGRSRHGAGTLEGRVDIRRRERVYANYFALDEFDLSHEKFDGTMSDVVERAVFVATDAALVLPYDPVRDRVLLVEQMRMGPLGRGDRAVWQLAPIAGRVDGGETPEQAARREAAEEAGLTLQTLEPVAEVYASPGDSTEFFYIYVGIADLPDRAAGTGGLDEEHEDIRSHLMSFDDLLALCDARAAANAPLALAGYWLARHRERLRLAGGAATPEATR